MELTALSVIGLLAIAFGVLVVFYLLSSFAKSVADGIRKTPGTLKSKATILFTHKGRLAYKIASKTNKTNKRKVKLNKLQAKQSLDFKDLTKLEQDFNVYR